MFQSDRNIKNIKILIVLSIIFGTLFFSLRVLQYKSFFSFEWEDDARHNQVIYNIATSLTPHQTIFQNQQPRFLNDHFHPIYFFIALFYKIYPHMYTWYFIMCFSYGFSSITVYLLARHILKDEKLALIVSSIYLFYPPLHYATLGALDAISFTLPIIFLVFYFLYTKKYFPYLLFMVLSCLCREDIPLYIFILGIYQIFKKYPKKFWCSTLIFSSIYFSVAVYVANNFGNIFYKQYDTKLFVQSYDYITLGAAKDLILFLFSDTKQALNWLFDWHKVRFFIMLLYPLLFLPVFSVELYLVLLIGFFQIGLPEGFFNQNSYYAALMTPFLFVSLIYALKKISMHISRRKLLCLALFILTTCLLGNVGRNIIGATARESKMFQEPYAEEYDRRFLDVKNIFDRRLYTVDEEDRMAWELIKMVPKDASVTVTGDLLPAVSSRRHVYEFGLNHPKAFEGEPLFSNYPYHDVDYILINKKCLINGLGGALFLVKKRRFRRGDFNHDKQV